MLVVLESTTYPGTTEEIVKPALEKAGLVTAENVFIAYSPERVDPVTKTSTRRTHLKFLSVIELL
jgi:UDP-N-acetyl-D-glucosamine dehydrogenase